MSLPLTKTLNPTDFDDLTSELRIVDRWFSSEREQHPMRRWEYAMALRAQNDWRSLNNPRPLLVYDIGGAGSPFRHMVDHDGDVAVIDPDEPAPNNYRLEDIVHSARLASNVFCLSVVEHVPDLNRFLYYLSCLVAPGGLLFLTMDCWSNVGPDTAHFHWMRKRIFEWPLRSAQFYLLENWSFRFLGGIDRNYHGDQLYGSYTFGSLSLMKRP